MEDGFRAAKIRTRRGSCHIMLLPDCRLRVGRTALPETILLWSRTMAGSWLPYCLRRDHGLLTHRAVHLIWLPHWYANCSRCLGTAAWKARSLCRSMIRIRR